jgi:hypothetical protein
MSAVPGNFLDFGSWDTTDINGLDLPDTQSTDYSTLPINDGLPDNVLNVPRSDGITWTGVLDAAKSSADTLFGVFNNVYNLQSKIEDAKYQRTVNEANMQIRHTSG